MQKKKSEFYSLDPIHKKGKDCKYYMIFGQRSNGKTYSVEKKILTDYIKTRKQGAILRRMGEDFKGKRGQSMFADFIPDIDEWTGSRYNSIRYFGRKWFLIKYDESGKIESQDPDPFCYGFAISEQEHDKSTSYPRINTVLFDEFISRTSYLPDEFVLFMNSLSTIIRNRDTVKIYMLGNTVNKFCPYFKEMGIKHAKDMNKGDIDIYTYGNSSLRVAVEYADAAPATRKSADYFAFDNPKLNMITGGDWELDIYPHAPCRFRGNDIKYRFFLEWDDSIFEGDIVKKDKMKFLFFHEKTTPIKYPDKDLIFSPEYSAKPNRFRSIRKNYNPLVHKIGLMFSADRVFYQNNDVGDQIKNYLTFCDTL